MSEKIEKAYGSIELMDSIKEPNLIKAYQFNHGLAFVWYYDRIELVDAAEWLINLTSERLNELVRVRIFDEEQELHLWRSNRNIKGRFIKDIKSNKATNDKDQDWVDAKLPLNGSVYRYDSGHFVLYSDKDQFYLNLPKSMSKLAEGNVFIKTRNYIDFNDIDQAGYVDCRYVSISNIK